MIPRRIQHRADVSEGSIFLDHGGIPHSLGDYSVLVCEVVLAVHHQ